MLINMHVEVLLNRNGQIGGHAIKCRHISLNILKGVTLLKIDTNPKHREHFYRCLLTHFSPMTLISQNFILVSIFQTVWQGKMIWLVASCMIFYLLWGGNWVLK